jgi:hypothetical protein
MLVLITSKDQLYTIEYNVYTARRLTEAEQKAITEKELEIKTNFGHMLFNFNDNSNKLELEKSKELVEQGYCGYYCGPIDGITLAWPVERDEPLPPPVQANLEMFPEVNRKTFFDDAKIMPKFEFGYFKELVDTLGRDSFRQSIITRHHPGMYIRQHIDSKVLKLHIPIESNENSLFHFGKDRDRSYHLKVGKVYILNTGDWHGTSNDTDEIRSHIITRIADWQIDHVLSLC